MTSVLTERVDDIERRLRGLEREMRDVQAVLATAEKTAPAEDLRHAPQPPPASRPLPSPPLPSRPQPAPTATSVAPPAPPKPSRSLGEVLEAWDLLGARGLALVGGAVTLLGIAFFFVLAANHGWIGPLARVSLGGGASALVFAAGLVLRSRYGQLHSAVAAAGAGVAGAYTTLLAAVAIYDLLPESAGLALAAGIAAAAVAVAIRWSSEVLAWLGLLGAAAVPALHALDGTLTASAVAFVLFVFAGAAAVSLRQRWPLLLAATAITAYAQVLWLVLVADTGDHGAIAVASAFFALLLATSLAQQRVAGAKELDPLASPLSVGAAGLALIASLTIFDSQTHAGVELLVAAAVVVVAAALAARFSSDLSVLLGGAALALGAVGTADLLSSRSLTIVWAAEATLLGGAGMYLRQPRLRLAGLAYVALASVHAIATEAPLKLLFDADATSYARAIPSVAGVALAATVAGWGEIHSDRLAPYWPAVRAALVGVAALAALDAISLGIVAVSFTAGHVVVTGIWAAAGLAVVVACTRLRRLAGSAVGFGWLAVTAVKAVSFDWPELGSGHGAVAVLALAVPVVLAGVALRALDDRDDPLGIVSFLCSSFALVGFVAAIGTLVDSDRLAGVAVLAPAGLFVGLSAAVFRVERLRNLATILWGHGLWALVIAEAAIVQGRAIAVAYAATAAVVALLARRLAERRLHVAGLVLLGGTTLVTLCALTPPTRLFDATEHPAVSLWVLGACVAAGAVLAACDDRTRTRTWTGWLTAGLAVYGISLGILELAERISPASIDTDFQRGHTVVTAFWGLIGLGLLVAGLLRRLPVLRYGGLALFGLSLAKLFLYDLSALSSVTRALSFLAVGAFMLAGGFFLQRVGARLASPSAPSTQA